MKDLAGAEAVLAEKEQVLSVMRIEYEAACQKKQALEDDASSCRRRMNTAKMLIDGLSGKGARGESVHSIWPFTAGCGSGVTYVQECAILQNSEIFAWILDMLFLNMLACTVEIFINPFILD